jgi:hypothetical protein
MDVRFLEDICQYKGVGLTWKPKSIHIDFRIAKLVLYLCNVSHVVIRHVQS